MKKTKRKPSSEQVSSGVSGSMVPENPGIGVNDGVTVASPEDYQTDAFLNDYVSMGLYLAVYILCPAVLCTPCFVTHFVFLFGKEEKVE